MRSIKEKLKITRAVCRDETQQRLKHATTSEMTSSCSSLPLSRTLFGFVSSFKASTDSLNTVRLSTSTRINTGTRCSFSLNDLKSDPHNLNMLAGTLFYSKKPFQEQRVGFCCFFRALVPAVVGTSSPNSFQKCVFLPLPPVKSTLHIPACHTKPFIYITGRHFHVRHALNRLSSPE